MKNETYGDLVGEDAQVWSAEDASSGLERRLLRSNLHKAGVDATEVIEESRKLQQDCDDIEGFYGLW